MKFREHLKTNDGIEKLLTNLHKDISEITNPSTAEYVVDELLSTKRTNTLGLESVVHEVLTGIRAEDFEKSDKEGEIDEKAYQVKIDELKNKNPKFKSICIRMALAMENIKKAKKK
jgi:hypothetical protein